MRAMVLAAGMGTRLQPLTNERPKALVEVAGRTLLEITLARLRGEGVRDVIVNVHHFADMVIDYLQANHNFGMHIEVSREEILLDTGGGLKKAGYFFLSKAGHPEEPFLVHNVDVVSTIDLAAMVRSHREKQALATLAVQRRNTSRYLLFDGQLRLCGRQTEKDVSAETAARFPPPVTALAFSGIHVVSPRLFAKLTEEGAFSIVTAYLRLAAEGERIQAFEENGAYWCDLGRPESVAQAAEDLKQQTLSY
ncbi:MAG TPA: nucleotidyltransferase family protein [Acidobacteriaceae bacterium]|nr:nucleotidyltransferase family protein [Acidobacteriaceae bacterium]